MKEADGIYSARMCLVETGGRTSQDLGLGRIVGQILVYLYLQPQACTLDKLETDLGLSKASVSIAARQLEHLGLIKRVWVKGERKKYYRSAENIGQALQQGLLSIIRQKVDDFGEQLETALGLLDDADESQEQEVQFLRKRIDRANHLQKQLYNILNLSLTALLSTKMGPEHK